MFLLQPIGLFYVSPGQDSPPRFIAQDSRQSWKLGSALLEESFRKWKTSPSPSLSHLCWWHHSHSCSSPKPGYHLQFFTALSLHIQFPAGPAHSPSQPDPESPLISPPPWLQPYPRHYHLLSGLYNSLLSSKSTLHGTASVIFKTFID